jgi:hypothetical protein
MFAKNQTMKLFLIPFTFVFLIVSSNSVAQNGCPKLAVLVDNYDIQPGDPAVFTVVSSTWGNMVSLQGKTFNWSVSAGTITNGQGTNSIRVSTSGSTGIAVIATVEVKGLASQCPTSAKGTINIKAQGSGTVWKPTNVCVLEKDKLSNVQAMYNTATGDTLLFRENKREVFRDFYSTDNSYARGYSWYINNETITLNGKSYVKYGLPRILYTTDVVKAGSYKGVTVFAEPSKAVNPEVIYIPVRLDCEFQPYQRK